MFFVNIKVCICFSFLNLASRVQYLTPKIVLDRLVTRRHHYLAIQIAKYLQMPENEGSSRILVQWAKYKVSKKFSLTSEHSFNFNFDRNIL